MRKDFLIISLLVLLALPALAELTVKDVRSPDYLHNHGYSRADIVTIQKEIAKVNGEALEEPLEYKYYGNPIVKGIRRFFMYFDPSLDDHSFDNDHEIKTSPSYKDL